MGAELPVERICQPNPCLCTTHQFRCVLRNHGRTWQMRCVGSLAPIFWGRTRFLWYKWIHKRFWGWVITKNDDKPIFTFLAQPQIWEIESQDGENQRGIYFLEYLTPKTIALYFRHINISPPPKYGGQTPRNAFISTKTIFVCMSYFSN